MSTGAGHCVSCSLDGSGSAHHIASGADSPGSRWVPALKPAHGWRAGGCRVGHVSQMCQTWPLPPDAPGFPNVEKLQCPDHEEGAPQNSSSKGGPPPGPQGRTLYSNNSTSLTSTTNKTDTLGTFQSFPTFGSYRQCCDYTYTLPCAIAKFSAAVGDVYKMSISSNLVEGAKSIF